MRPLHSNRAKPVDAPPEVLMTASDTSPLPAREQRRTPMSRRGRRGMMRAATLVAPALGRLTLTRAAAFSRSESGLVALALAAIALHVVDDNYVEPQSGTSAGDHLASGLVPIAVLTAVAALYPRLRGGLRACPAMTMGAIGIAFGVP